jgi:hypothetical protein
MDTRFVKRIIQATDDLDTLIYVNSQSFDEAITKWLRDLVKALNTVIKTFEPLFTIPISASSSFEERRLEQKYQEFLTRITEYVAGVDLVFARKSLQYAKIARKLHGPKELTDQTLVDIKEAEDYLHHFEKTLELIRTFSQKQMLFAKGKKLNNLAKYKYQFNRLTLFEKLNLELAISLLKEKTEI